MADYSALVVDHFDRPRNAGRFEAAPDVVEGSAGSAAQGASFHLSAKVRSGIAAAVRFEAYGCPHCIAAASVTTQQLEGRRIADMTNWSWRDVAKVLEIPAEKRGHLLVLEDAVKRLADAGRAHT